jgi:hypothetical protein
MNRFSPEQKMALVAMLRDVYMPNIGRPSYNLYLLPEFNCAPFSFVASELGSSAAALSDATTTWRPQHSERLWAGAAYKLRNLSEVLEATRGHPLPGINPTETTSDALTVLALNRARLE